VRVHLVNPSEVSFGTAVITPRWLYVLAAATPQSFGIPFLVDETLVGIDPNTIQRGDIVVFRYPRDTSKSFIKRVIGLAGDRIRIESGEVFVNGEALEEDYVPAAYADQRSYSEIVVPLNSYFVLGDHRTMSNDSRDFGPVSIGYIYGKAVFGYWPMDKMGRVR